MSEKPLNYDKAPFRGGGCDTTSSNCVIWNGPDIPSLGICKGDNITIAIHKLAVQIIQFKRYFNIDNYDMTCLVGKDCKPKDFQEFIQLLIDKICEKNNVETPSPTTPNTTQSSGSNEGDNIPIPQMFYYENEKGDTVRHMPLKHYVTTLGNKLVETVNIGRELVLSTRNLSNVVDELSNKPDPEIELPTVRIDGKDKELVEAIEDFDKEFKTYKEVLGTPIQLLSAISKESSKFNSIEKLNGRGNYGDVDNWVSGNNNNVAGSINNIWIMISDIYNYIKGIKKESPDICESINLEMKLDRVGDELRVSFTGDIPNGVFTTTPSVDLNIKDQSGNTITKSINVIEVYSSNTYIGFDISNEALNKNDVLLVEIPNVTFTNDIYYCGRYLNGTVGDYSCPELMTVIGKDKIDIFFAWLNNIGTVRIDLVDVVSDRIVDSKDIEVSRNGQYMFTFDNLTADSGYNLITKYKSNGVFVTCNEQSIKTLND